MRAVTKPLGEQAQSIFSELGYTVTDDGSEYLATRKWRAVRVTPVESIDSVPADGDYRCFVTWADDTAGVAQRLERADPDYEWAIIGVDEDGDYEVVHETGL